MVATINGKLIEFRTKDSYNLQGFLISKKNKKLIIFVHGMAGNFSANIGIRMYKILINNGFDVFFINTRGHDIISRTFVGSKTKFKKITAGTAYEKFEESIHDVAAAISVIAGKYKKIFLAGHSTGCQKVLNYFYKTKDRRVVALILLAPGDDFNSQKHHLGAKWKDSVRRSEILIKNGKGNELMLDLGLISAQRFNSVSNLNRIESRLFNYDSDLKEFSAVKIPVFAAFGSKDKHRTKSVAEYIKRLESKTLSNNFMGVLIKNANHSFNGYEIKLSKKVVGWLKGV